MFVKGSVMKKLAAFAFAFLFLSAFVHAQPSPSTTLRTSAWNLQQCIDSAWKRNILLRQTIAGNTLNVLNENQSRWAQFPNLNGSATQGFNWGRSVDPFTYQYVNQGIRTNNFSLSSTWVLFEGFQYRNTIQKYGLDVQAGQAGIEKTRNDIALNVVGAYLQILLAKEQREVTKNLVASTQADVDRTQQLVTGGKVAEANLYQLKSQLATYKSQQIDAENQIIMAKLTLQQLMEIPVSPDFDIVTPELPKELPPMDTTMLPQQVYNTALTNQPQIKQSDWQMKSAVMSLKINRGAYYPRLTLGGSFNTGYSSARSLLTYQTVNEERVIGYVKDNPTEIVASTITQIPVSNDYPFTRQVTDNFAQTVAFTLGVPIFNNMVARINVQRAQIGIEQAQLNDIGIRNDLRKSVEQAVTDLKGADKKYAAALEAQQYSNIALQNMQERFNLGLATATDFFIQKSGYRQAESQVLQAKYDLLFKQKIVDFYLGKGIKL